MTAPNKHKTSKQRPHRLVVLVTGMSGAGLSTALKAFEDLGYESVDNLRLSLISTLVKEGQTDCPKPLAVAVDTRNIHFSVEALLLVEQELRRISGIEIKLVFLECSDENLLRRFTETRRRHPLALDRPVVDGIRREREMLYKLRDAADHVIDTSSLSVHELRRLIVGQYKQETAPGLTLFITSFSYRHGVPREADLVFDVRFLVNPYWEPKLRSLTGQDSAVADHIRRDADCGAFLNNLTQLILPLLPRYQQEGKSYLTIAIGCTGGRHRSVFMAEQLATILAGHGYITGVGHRDLDRPANKA